ncbi:MAG: CDP-alcohol phosphatidyltransferase family protein [Erysipelotrichaceae bacterium]
MANVITGLRIVFSLALLFCESLSLPFIVLYLLAGISDMLDGFLARMTNTVSEFGSKFDTVADCVFFAVCVIKLRALLNMDIWLVCWIGFIGIIKMINVGLGFIIHKSFVAIHSMMNRITGIILFILPLTLKAVELKYSAGAVCLIATFAAIDEMRSILFVLNKGESDVKG